MNGIVIGSSGLSDIFNKGGIKIDADADECRINMMFSGSFSAG